MCELGAILRDLGSSDLEKEAEFGRDAGEIYVSGGFKGIANLRTEFHGACVEI